MGTSTVTVTSTPDRFTDRFTEPTKDEYARKLDLGIPLTIYTHCRLVPPVMLQVSVAVCPEHSGPGYVRVKLAVEDTNMAAYTKES